MSGFTWQDLRNVLIYPMMLAGGIAWSLLFVARMRGCARVETVLATALGASIALMGALGLLALGIASHFGPGTKPGSFVFFLAVAAPAVVVVVGAVRLFVLTWREGHSDGD